jgi:hypothetical protein
MSRLTFGGARIVDINAQRPLDEVRKDVRSAIWECI